MKRNQLAAFILIGMGMVLAFQNCSDVGLKSMATPSSVPLQKNATLSGVFCHPEKADDVTQYALSEFYVLNLNVRKFNGAKAVDSDVDGVVDTLQTTSPGSNTIFVSPQDSDEDELPDFVEVLKGLNPTADDLYEDGIDLDGVTNIGEVQLGTDPSAADADHAEISYTVDRAAGTAPDGCGAGQKAYEFNVTKLPILSTKSFVDVANVANPALSLSHGTNENVILLIAKMDSVDATVESVFLAKIFRKPLVDTVDVRFKPADFFILSDSYTPCADCKPPNLNLTYNKIFTGFHHACAISTTNKLFCWGDNSYGQLGDDSTQKRLYPTAVQNLPEDVETAALGYGHTCVLTKPGNVYCWGRNFNNQLGNSNTQDSSKPVKVDLGTGLTATKLTASSRYNCAVIGASAPANIKCWGKGYGSTLTTITVSAGVGSVTSISAGDGPACISDSYRNAYCWPIADPNKTLADGFFKVQAPNYCVPDPDRPGWCYVHEDPHSWTQIGTNGVAITGIDASSAPSGKIVCWGGSCAEMENSEPENYDSHTSGIELVKKVVMGPSHTCALRGLLSGDSEINCWGNNSYGQAGQTIDLAQPSVIIPTSVSITKPIDVAVSANYSCGIDNEGHLWCWGINDYGQLGTGNTINPTSPQKVIGQ